MLIIVVIIIFVNVNVTVLLINNDLLQLLLLSVGNCYPDKILIINQIHKDQP